MLAGYVTGGMLVVAASRRQTVKDYWPSRFLLGAGTLLSFAALAFGLVVATGDASVRGLADQFLSRAIGAGGRLLNVLAGADAARYAVTWASALGEIALGVKGALASSALYLLAGLALVLHIMAQRAARLALKTVAVLWLLVGAALLGLG